MSDRTSDEGVDFLWGCKAIAGFIGRTPRQTFHLLEAKKLPAGKVGATWVASRSALTEYLHCIARGDDLDALLQPGLARSGREKAEDRHN